MSLDLNSDGLFDLQDLIVIATAICSIIGALVLLRKHIAKPFGRWLHREMADFVNEAIAPNIEVIKHEVTANDGGSLKDLVKNQHAETLRIFEERDKAFARLAQPAARRLDTVEAGLRALNKNYAEILERLDGLSRQGASDSAAVLHKLDEQDP